MLTDIDLFFPLWYFIIGFVFGVAFMRGWCAQKHKPKSYMEMTLYGPLSPTKQKKIKQLICSKDKGTSWLIDVNENKASKASSRE